MKNELVRSSSDRFIGGVCGGLAQAFGIESWIVRVIFVALALFGFSGVGIYVIVWLILPRDDTRERGIEEFSDWLKRIFNN
ncbi:MAG: PspC domain-containing protein [Propionibacteriaceae bacterium]|jgi:phage shock protein PspC (stress-responsive transcriptional regulator)|nr:PspC domain-containing protein [Propionibacteriaceae bacterium]